MAEFDFSGVDINKIKTLDANAPSTTFDFSGVDINKIANLEKPTNYQWSGEQPSNYNVVEGQDKTTGEQDVKARIDKILPPQTDLEALGLGNLSKLFQDAAQANISTQTKAKENPTLLKVAQIQTNVSDEALNREAEYGVNNSTYGNTQRVVNSATETKLNILDNPNATGKELQDDLNLKLSSIKQAKLDLEKSKQAQENSINQRWAGEQSYLELAKVGGDYTKKIEELDKTYNDLKDIYTSEEQRLKIDPIVQIYNQDPNSLTKITDKQWDELASNYGPNLVYIGEPENEVNFLKARDYSDLNLSFLDRINKEANNAGSAEDAFVAAVNNTPIDKREIQKVNRLGELTMLDDLSNVASKKADELNEIVKGMKDKWGTAPLSKEDYAKYKQEFDQVVTPKKQELDNLTTFIKDKAAKSSLKYKELKEFEDKQKEIDYFDNLEGHTKGSRWALTENVANLIPKFTTGLKQLYRLTQTQEEQDLYGISDVVNYEFNSLQVPTYYKQTPAVEFDKDAALGLKINSSAWYNIAKVSAESIELIGLATLTGGTSLEAQAGLGSLKSVLAGLGSRASIVIPTMIMTSADATASYYNQGLSASQANKLGLVTGFIEGLTEIVNPIEVTGLNKLVTLSNRISNQGAYRVMLNKVFKEVTGKAPSKELVKLLLKDTGKFTLDFLGQGGMEAVEEEVGLLLNSIKNKEFKKNNPDFNIDPSEEATLENAVITALNTMITMPVLGLFGAGVNLYQEKNSAFPTARFIAGKDANLLFSQLETDKPTLAPEVYKATKDEITKQQSLYNGEKFTLDNIPEEDQQITYFNLVNEQQQLAKEVLSKPNNTELSTKLDNVSEQISNIREEALFNSAKTPQEKLKIAENIVIKGIDKVYTPQFIASISDKNIEQVKQDLVNRASFLKSPKVNAKIEEILTQIAEKDAKQNIAEQIKTEDDTYVEQKQQETLLNSTIAKLQTDEPLTPEEQQFAIDNEELITNTLYSDENMSDASAIFGVPAQEPAPIEEASKQEVSDIEAKKAHIERRREKEYESTYKSNNPANQKKVVPTSSEELAQIDAKYDAELAALEEPIIEPKQTVQETTTTLTSSIPESNLTIEQERQILEQTEEDVDKANNTSVNTVAKLVKVEEQGEQSEELPFMQRMLISAYDKIAYQARKFVQSPIKEDVDNVLNPEFSFLNSPEINEGTEIIFILSPTNSFIQEKKDQFVQNKDGLLQLGVITEDEYEALLQDNDNFVEISITDKANRNFGSIHTIDYIREDRVVAQLAEEQEYGDNLKDNLTNLIKLRKDLLSQIRTGVTPKATITDKSIGVLSTKSDNSYSTLREAFKNEDVLNTIQVVLKPNEVLLGSKPTVNTTALSNMLGQVTVLIPTPQGNNFALGLKKKSVGSERAKALTNSIRFYSDYNAALIAGDLNRLKELDQIAISIQEIAGNEYDIRDFEGLRQYISLLVYNTARTSSFTSPDTRIERKDIPFIDFDNVAKSITYSNKRSFATKEANEELSSIDKLKEVGIFRQNLFNRDGSVNTNSEFFLSNFEKFLSERTIVVNSNFLADNQPFEVPLLSDDYQLIDDNTNTKAPTYKDFILDNVETNVLEHTITSPSSKPEFSYFQQPTISFELEKPKTEKKKTKGEIYRETDEFKDKIVGFTPINIDNKQFFFKLEGTQISLLNTKGNKLRTSAKNYPEILEAALTLNYETLKPEINLFNNLFADVVKRKNLEDAEVTLSLLNSIMGIPVRTTSLEKIYIPFYNTVFNIEATEPVDLEEVTLTEEELADIDKQVEENFPEDVEKNPEELNLTEEYNTALKQQIEYENKVEQEEIEGLDDSTEETPEESEDDFLEGFSLYDEPKETEQISNSLENQYKNLSLAFSNLTPKEKAKIGSLEDFIKEYTNTGVQPTEEFLIEELNCRKGK